MKVKYFKKEANGDAEIAYVITPDQQSLLIQYAIESLLARGFVTTVEIDEAEVKQMNEEIQQAIAEKWLAAVPPENMGHA